MSAVAGTPSGVSRRLMPVLGLLLTAAAASGWIVISTSSSTPPLPDLGTVPDFELSEAAGTPLKRSDLAGQIWIADLIFTTCAGACPKMSAEMARLQEATADLPELKLVSFSVDPERDTAEALLRYAARFKADRRRWLFARGDSTTVRRLAQEGFRLAVSAGDPQAGEDPIIHSERFVLVDRQLRVRGTYDLSDGDSGFRLRRDLRRLVAEEATG